MLLDLVEGGEDYDDGCDHVLVGYLIQFVGIQQVLINVSVFYLTHEPFEI